MTERSRGSLGWTVPERCSAGLIAIGFAMLCPLPLAAQEFESPEDSQSLPERPPLLLETLVLSEPVHSESTSEEAQVDTDSPQETEGDELSQEMDARVPSVDLPLALNSVVLMIGEERRNEFSEALQLELAGRPLSVSFHEAPSGETAIARAAAAQQTAQSLGAAAAIWIEQAPATAGSMGTLVRAVGSDSQEVRHALLASRYDVLVPRVFAVVASSLIDELTSPPELPYAMSIPSEERADATVVEEEVAPTGPDQDSAEQPEPPELQAAIEAEGPQLRPVIFGFDFVPYLGLSLRWRGQERRMLSLNILGGLSGAIEGFEASALFNLTRHHLRGAQSTGLFNIVGGSVNGVQAAGLFNITSGSLTGIQAGGLFNMSMDRISGLQASGLFSLANGAASGAQASGIFSFARGDLSGAQASGVFNLAQGNVSGGQGSGVINLAQGAVAGGQAGGVINLAFGSLTGLQLSGVSNIAVGDVHGLQASGVVNIAQGDVEGVQAAGVVNIAGAVNGGQLGIVNIARGAVRGTQLGLVNVARQSNLSLGLVNIVRDGRYHLDIYGSETGFINVSFRHGSRYLHNIFTFGKRVQDAGWSYGVGLGGHVPIRPWVYIDIDLLTHQIVDGVPMGELALLNQVRVVAGFQVIRWLAITLGLSYNVLVTTRGDGSEYPLFADSTFSQRPDLTVRGWPGFILGVQLLPPERGR